MSPVNQHEPARMPGRAGAVLSPAQLAAVLDALADAVEYRATHAGLACSDCAAAPGNHCQDHAGDHERAAAYDALAAQLRQEASR